MKLSEALRVLYRKYMRKYGFTNYYYNFFDNKQKAALKDHTFSAKDRAFAKKTGFYPWRILQYGLTEQNYKNIISDRDYYYLYPLNNRYRMWIDDKLTTKYVLSPFDQYLPEYYYHINDGKVLRLMNCPKEYECSYDGVISLLQDKRRLAVKACASYGGFSFYKLEAKGNTYFVNEEEKTEGEMRQLLASLNDFIITEFLLMHPDIEQINPTSVNTLRVMVINENGDDPVIPYVYFRIGTERSGIVDNVTQGGMVCKVDVASGHYYDAESLSNHVYHKEIVHPDTKTPLEGILPNWDLVKETLINISKYIPDLRWLGFDVAITPDGFKIVEINSHQGVHKANLYPPEVNQFLFSELKKKKKRYGIK